ncbi:MAG: hypothetical protein ACREM1_12925 [Longimicrobiales bacterium]
MASRQGLLSSLTVVSLFAGLSAGEGAAQASEPTGSQEVQSNPQDVRLFQSFFSDALISRTGYVGGAASAQEYPGGNAIELDAMGGYAFTPQIEIQGRLGFLRSSPDEGDGSSGLTDLLVTGQYLFDDLPLNDAGDVMDIAVGGYTDLPIGESEVGGNTLDFGVFGALRYDLNERLALAGNLGIDFVKTPSSFTPGFCIPGIYLPVCTQGNVDAGGRETSLNIGGGAIYGATDQLNLVGELRIETEFDYAALSGGVDYAVTFGHIRGALLVGLDDGAPDVGLVMQLVRGL